MHCDMPTDWFWERLEPITRVWGLITSIVVFGVGLDLCFYHELAGAFAITGSVTALFLETTWALTICLQIALRNENHPCFTCWDAALWFDTWKKTVIYWCFALLLFAQPHRLWFTTTASLSLFLLGLLHGSLFYKQVNQSEIFLIEDHDDGVARSDTYAPIPTSVVRVDAETEP